MEPKQLITDYLRALSGVAKTPDLVRQYVADEALIEHIAQVEAAFPAYELITEQMVAERDLVAVRATFRGVHRGVFAGIQPTGKIVSSGLMITYGVADDKIVEHWMQFDFFSLLQQLQDSSVAAA
jgi:predicted ester cyclase